MCIEFFIMWRTFPKNLKKIACKMKEKVVFLWFLNMLENWPKIFSIHTFILETFYKKQIILKVNDIFEFCENWLVYCTWNFYLNTKVIF